MLIGQNAHPQTLQFSPQAKLKTNLNTTNKVNSHDSGNDDDSYNDDFESISISKSMGGIGFGLQQ